MKVGALSIQEQELKRAGIVLETLPADKELLKDGTIDFLTLSYYSSHVSSTTKNEVLQGNLLQNIIGKSNSYLHASDWGWQIDPLGLGQAVTH